MNKTQRIASRVRAKSDTIEALGLETFLNDRYGTDAYRRFIELLTAGEPDWKIAQAFSAPSRNIHYRTVSNWRKHYTNTEH